MQAKTIANKWGDIEQQNAWRRLKQVAITEGQLFYETHNDSFLDLYRALAQKRKKIAEDMRHYHVTHGYNDPYNMGVFRIDNVSQRSYVTPISPDEKSPYSSFYPYLLKLIKKMAHLNQALPVHKCYFRQIDFDKHQLSESLCVEISVCGKQRTSLILGEGVYEDSRPYSKIFIEHINPNSSAYKTILIKIEQLHKKLKEPGFSSEREAIIKTMIWYLSHAVLCERGSASITEMCIEILCKKYGIPFAPPTLIPMDLIALFSESPESFSLNLSSFFLNELSEPVTSSDKTPLLRDASYHLSSTASTSTTVTATSHSHALKSSETWAIPPLDRDRTAAVFKVSNSNIKQIESVKTKIKKLEKRCHIKGASEETQMAIKAICTILNDCINKTMENREAYFKQKKPDLERNLTILKKTSQITTLKNAIATILAVVSVIGLLVCIDNYYSKGDAFLFFSGNKQDAQEAINAITRLTISQ